jgi:hypothetical protein
MKKIKLIFTLTAFVFLANINVSTAQRIFVNDVDINELDIEYVELSVTSKLLNPTKMKIYVDYGQKWSIKRQNIMNPEKKVIPFNSTIHALNFMDKNGWVYVEQTAVTDDGSTTYKYLLKKAG